MRSCKEKEESCSVSCDEIMRNFMGLTRELSECAECSGLLLDPVEAKCGHFFCRDCITEVSSAGEQTYLCAVCQSPVYKHDLKELNSKKKTANHLQHFMQDFCREGDLEIETFLSSHVNPVQQNSRSSPLKLQKKEKTAMSKTTAADDFEEGNNSNFHCSSASSELAQQSTLEPAHKVHQWLMTNPNVDPLAIPSEENGANVNNRSSTHCNTNSFETSKLLTYVTVSSTSKDSSYDIVSAPSPPPSREISQKGKRGRGCGRGRGRLRKNVLPISSGESSRAKKRERSNDNTPETGKIAAKTPAGLSNFSPEIQRDVPKTPSIVTSSTPLTASKPSIEKNDRTNETQDSHNETISTLGEKERNIFVGVGNSCAQPIKEVLEKSADTEQVAYGSTTNGFADDLRSTTPNLEVTTPLPQRILANRSNLHSPIKTASPQIDKSVSVPFKPLHHLTPVSRPKLRNSLGPALRDVKTSDRDFRRHSIAEVSEARTERRNVNFFRRGCIVPKKSICLLMKKPIVFTLMGKLGPHLDRSSPNIPISQESLVCTIQKCVEDKETQTFSEPVSFASVATQVEPPEASILADNDCSVNDSQKSLTAQLQTEDIGKILSMLENAPGEIECSEDALMFVEPIKRSRVLSSSDSDNEKMNSKRKKPCPSSVKSYNTDDPAPSTSSTSTEKPITPEVPHKLDSQLTVADLTSKTVVTESDLDEDDILVATPPRPPPPKPIPRQKKVLTCSGLSRAHFNEVEDWARHIGAEVCMSYNSSVTHIIVKTDKDNCAQRTLKFLYGVASAKWVVGINWVHQCNRENRLISEEPFEALDMDGEDGPRRARQTSHRIKLFAEFEFCCQEPFFDVTVDQLNQLLELCGAVTVKTPAELSKRRRHSLIVVQIDEEVSPEVLRKAASWFDSFQVLTVSREWVLDCLASYQLLPVRNQLIGKHRESMLRMMGFNSHLLA